MLVALFRRLRRSSIVNLFTGLPPLRRIAFRYLFVILLMENNFFGNSSLDGIGFTRWE